MPTLKDLKADEHKAIKDYSTAIDAAKTPHEAETLEHIRGEEKEHAKELAGLLKGLKPVVHDLTLRRAKGGFISTHSGKDHVLTTMDEVKKHFDEHLGE